MQCPACGGEPRTERLSVNEMMFGRDEVFAYAECSACGCLWLEDVPENLGAYYPEDYYSVDLDPEAAIGRPVVRQFATAVARSVLFGGGRVASVSRAALPLRQFHSYVRVLESIAFAGLPKGRETRVLDVGCGSGLMVYALALAGVRTSVGVDPFAPRDRVFDSGAKLWRRGIAEVEGTYDLIMFHHSFEHVPDPSEAIGDAVRLLAPGGRILVRMPTRSSLAFDRYGASWVQLDAPRHLTIFSREGVRVLAEKHDLVIADVMDDSSAFQFWGSEQVMRRIPLMDARSHLMAPRHSSFSRRQIRSWERESAQLNHRHRGDQAAWILEHP